MQRISETARGRWHGILPLLGISPKLLRNKHGPCPMCGGKDRFRFDDRDGKGTWICNRCGSGDGAELVKRVLGVQFKEAAQMVESVVESAVRRTPKPRLEANKAELNNIWQTAKPIIPDDRVGHYLKLRCGLEKYPSELRWHPKYGMVARVMDGSGKPVTIHTTWINDANGAIDRKLMPGKLPDNVAIRLAPAGPVLGIAEGIETALSASAVFQVPAWAAISAPLLKKWRPPPGVTQVMIFGDNDENFTGQEAAYSLARSLSGELKALSGHLQVKVKIPSMPGWDWNDVHRNNLDNR